MIYSQPNADREVDTRDSATGLASYNAVDQAHPSTAASENFGSKTNGAPLAGASDASLSQAQPRTSSDSKASSDLELQEMVGRDDPLFAGAANGRKSADAKRFDPSRPEWQGGEEALEAHAADEREARRLGSRQFFYKTLINCILIGLWYLLSISMSVYNKWMFSPGNLDFHYPLFTTSVHMLVQFFLASSVLVAVPRFRPQHGAIDPHDGGNDSAKTEDEDTDPNKPIMTLWFYTTRIVSCGAVTGLDIGLGNMSLKFISLTFFTMCKSSTLGFVLGFAILFRLERPSWKIGGIIAVMTIGVIMMVAGETAFDGLGFVLLMLASFFSGLRWSLTQILLRRTPATSNPFSTLFFITPVMFAILFLLAIPVEGFGPLFNGLDRLKEIKGLPLGIGIVLFPGCIAFLMTSAEFALLKRTSVVTLSVCGIFKEVLTITAAGFIFGDELTPINISGLLITIGAIAVYNVTRMRKMRREEMDKAQDKFNEEHAPMIIRDDGAGNDRSGLATGEGSSQGHTSTVPTENGLLTTGTGHKNPLQQPAAFIKRRNDYEELAQEDR